MFWTVMRVAGALLSAFVTAALFAIDFAGFKPGIPWAAYALAAFLLFAGFVAWGWGASELRLHQRVRIEKLLTRISALRIEGVALQNQGVGLKTDESIDTWWNRAEDWHARVEAEMVRIHPADPGNWRTLGTYDLRGFKNAHSLDLIRKLNMLALRLEKLEKYIDERTRK